jgi:hypothetical protein
MARIPASRATSKGKPAPAIPCASRPRCARPSPSRTALPAPTRTRTLGPDHSRAHRGTYGAAFDGDTICVTPDFRAQVKGDNAAASSRKAASSPQPTPATGHSVVFEVTGSSTVYTTDIDPGGSVATENTAVQLLQVVPHHVGRNSSRGSAQRFALRVRPPLIAQKPSFPSCFGSRCQFFAILTRRSRYTFVPSSFSIWVRAAVPTSRSLAPPLPITMPFWLSRSTYR